MACGSDRHLSLATCASCTQLAFLGWHKPWHCQAGRPSGNAWMGVRLKAVASEGCSEGVFLVTLSEI